MKIVMICDFFNETLEYQENLLLKYYVKHKHAVTVIASTFESVFDYYSDRHDNSVPSRTYFFGGAKIIKLRYRYNFFNRVRAYTDVSGILAEERPDLIYVHDIIPNVLEAIRYKKHNPECRMILDYHADYSNSGRNWLSLKILHGVVRKWFLDRARKHLSKIFPIVPASATFLHEVYSVPHAEMELLPLGADTDLGTQVRECSEGRTIRARLGIGPEAKVIFTGGKLAPAKKTELLIEAVISLNQSDLHLIVAGEASEADAQYKKFLSECATGNPRIHFVGWLNREDIYRHLDMSDLAVFPASQSILWQQAISMGLPLIVGDAGHQDISYLNPYDNIRILPKDEICAERLAATISGILNDSAVMQHMHMGAMRVADELLNWDKLILKTLRFNERAAESSTLTRVRELVGNDN